MSGRRLTRRQFLTTASAATVGLTARRGFGAAPEPNPSSRPNVLFIAIDDLNDWVGCLGGHPDVKTPNLDRLASRGVLFTNAHCPAPLCNASRAALMTGIRPSTSGVYKNAQPWRDSPVLRDAVTLPQQLMANGYRALGAGKIYHGRFPDAASWDEYWPSQTRNRPRDPMPPDAARPLNGIPKTAHFDWGPIDAAKGDMSDWKVVDRTIEQLGRPHAKPFFLACGIFRPHLPWYVPQEYFDRYPLEAVTLPTVRRDDLRDVPALARRMAHPTGDHANVLEHGQWRRAVQGYLASVSFADDCVGRLIDALDASVYADNTAVVLWSDHGWHLGEKLHWRKFALWEEATRNVLMCVAPGVTEPGGRCDAPVNLLDIYPTLTDLCETPTPDAVEGDSLVPLLRDPAAPWDRPTLTTYGRSNHSVRSRRWRYTRYSDGAEELYDHDADPMEWDNLAAANALASVREDHARWLPTTNAEAFQSIQTP
jgi:arylsulfatase A-like enzyme